MKWITQVFLMEFRKIAAYRLDFWYRLLAPVILTSLVAWLLWTSIYESQGVSVMNGYSIKSIVFYYLIISFIERSIWAFGFRSGASSDIYEGTLSRYLIYPIEFFPYKWAGHLANGALGLIQLVILLLAFKWTSYWPSEFQTNILHICLGAMAVLIAASLAFLMCVLVDQAAFWAENVWSLSVVVTMLSGFFGGALIPLEFMPKIILELNAYLPFQFLFTWPLNTFLGKINFIQWSENLFLCLLWCALFYILNHLVWKRGIKHYSGVRM